MPFFLAHRFCHLRQEPLEANGIFRPRLGKSALHHIVYTETGFRVEG